MLKNMFLSTFFVVFLLGVGQAQPEDRSKGLPTSFPVPHTDDMLFYLQRSRNENTVIYDLNRKADGTVDAGNPINVYYIRFARDGKPWPLKWIERKFAYGYSHKKLKNQGGFQIELVAYDERKIELIPSNGSYKPYMTIAGQRALLRHIYVYADESGFWPKVRFVEIFGENPYSGAPIYERIDF